MIGPPRFGCAASEIRAERFEGVGDDALALEPAEIDREGVEGRLGHKVGVGVYEAGHDGLAAKVDAFAYRRKGRSIGIELRYASVPRDAHGGEALALFLERMNPGIEEKAF